MGAFTWEYFTIDPDDYTVCDIYRGGRNEFERRNLGDDKSDRE